MSSTVSQQQYAQLVQQHARQVLDFTRRLIADREDAEEVAQDAFVKAFHALPTFRGESSFLTWLLRIAYREALNHLRRRRPYTVDIESVSVVSEFGSLTSDDEAELSTGREERIRSLEEAVGELPPDDQLLLHLYYYDDRPLRDIAYIMDAEPNALGVRLHRIRKKLQTMIKQREYE
ncbi:MAG: sigma-70 family RNA polymerase sigma factor [Prevotella sp.]|nr:sigma-70 family RNA polymerase sigma factor [Prevotella sp.]